MGWKTYFGIPVPPWQKQKFTRAGAITLRFVIQRDVIPSKKNRQQIKTRRARGVLYVKKLFKEKGSMTYHEILEALDMVYSEWTPNEQYNRFVDELRPKLIDQMAKYSRMYQHRGLIFPIEKASCNIKIYQADRYHSDNDNKAGTVHDLLAKCGVIVDDEWRVLNPTNAESADYYEKIVKTIMVIDLTVHGLL